MKNLEVFGIYVEREYSAAAGRTAYITVLCGPGFEPPEKRTLQSSLSAPTLHSLVVIFVCALSLSRALSRLAVLPPPAPPSY